jgi:hypothetical protein
MAWRTQRLLPTPGGEVEMPLGKSADVVLQFGVGRHADGVVR